MHRARCCGNSIDIFLLTCSAQHLWGLSEIHMRLELDQRCAKGAGRAGSTQHIPLTSPQPRAPSSTPEFLSCALPPVSTHSSAGSTWEPHRTEPGSSESTCQHYTSVPVCPCRTGTPELGAAFNPLVPRAAITRAVLHRGLSRLAADQAAPSAVPCREGRPCVMKGHVWREGLSQRARGERVAHGDTLAGELHSWGDRFGASNKGE